MASRFMTDPHAMRDMAGRFEVHAQTVEDEARRMWASAQNISGAGWSGMAEATSLDTMTQMNQAFRNIVNMLHGVRDGLVRDANNYEQQEQASRFMTDPHAMRDMAGRFEVHAQTVEDEARRMWASAQNISGAGWSGMAEATSLDTMT
ncbi:esat-6 like protein [Mycobacterium tuberculosis]|nr:esat-6 like protein [Mycobacterium tuberculosis]